MGGPRHPSKEIAAEARRANQRAYWRRLYREVLEHYGGAVPHCACCGESEPKFLTRDHINGGGNEHRRKVLGTGNRGGIRFYFELRKTWPEGLQVLCFNCNQGKARNSGVCPHQER